MFSDTCSISASYLYSQTKITVIVTQSYPNIQEPQSDRKHHNKYTDNLKECYTFMEGSKKLISH
jgi:hypothetical protein